MEHLNDVSNENLLSDVYIRLGDLLRIEEQPRAAADEYLKALTIRLRTCPAHDRMLCDAHFSLALAYVDLSSDKFATGEAFESKQLALEQYLKAREVLRQEVAINLGTEKVNEPQELIDELTETIEALQADVSYFFVCVFTAITNIMQKMFSYVTEVLLQQVNKVKSLQLLASVLSKTGKLLVQVLQRPQNR